MPTDNPSTMNGRNMICFTVEKDMYIACQKELNTIYAIKETTNGKGIFATKDIPPQTILMRVMGDILDFASTKNLGEYESYTLQINIDRYILPNPPFRYVNHSCRPNTALDADLFLFSLIPIKAGEQICWDYSTSMLERSWTMKCSCGAPNCRGLITDFDLLPDELQQYYLRMGIVLPFILHNLKKQREHISNYSKITNNIISTQADGNDQ